MKILWIVWKVKLTNETVNEKTGSNTMQSILKERHLRWLVHAHLMEISRHTRQAMYCPQRTKRGERADLDKVSSQMLWWSQRRLPSSPDACLFCAGWPHTLKWSQLTCILQYFTITLLHPFNGPFFPRQPGYAGTRKVNYSGFYWSKRWWGGSGIRWTICKSFAPRSRRITTPVRHHSCFLQAECPSCHPTNSIKVLKAFKAQKALCITM